MKIGLIIIFVIISFCGYGQRNPRITPIPEIYGKIDTIAILYEAKYTKGNYIYRMRIINPTHDTIKYLSFSKKMPWYKVREKVNDTIYKTEDFYFCLTESEYTLLYPGESASFDIYSDPKETQIGLQFTKYRDNKTKYITWSKLINKEK
jgi:hypothetical protein